MLNAGFRPSHVAEVGMKVMFYDDTGRVEVGHNGRRYTYYNVPLAVIARIEKVGCHAWALLKPYARKEYHDCDANR